MRLANKKSIIIISTYVLLNASIITISLNQSVLDFTSSDRKAKNVQEITEIIDLEYFHLKGGLPQMSLAATSMQSRGQEEATFDEPKGVYNFLDKDKILRYQGDEGVYLKDKENLQLSGKVKVTSEEAEYFADQIKYFFKKDLIIGTGNVKFFGEDLKTKDRIIVESSSMRAKPEAQLSKFKGGVKGAIERKKKYEGKLTFSSHVLQMEGKKSLAQLQGDVVMKRDGYLITAGKADIFLENFNKSLKYFVLNDDVKVTETLQTAQGTTQRKAFSERLEGFGREEKMILSGAPRVEQGDDVIKGYRITIRENVDLIEVDDAMSDVQVKRKKLKD